MSIEVRDITKKYARFPALDNVSLKIESGELIALLGPSGSGKTTLLRTIAGLDFPDSSAGRIIYDGTDVTELSAYKRHAGFVFQHYALFNHMSIFENVAFGLRVMKRSKRPAEGAIQERVRKLLEAVQLAGYEKRLPSQLSGGQRQRVAFARALAIEPQVLLLDEPFGALDAKVRKELRRWLREFQDRIKLTTLFVTHDQEEAFEVADRVVLIDKGRIQQIGTPDEVRKSPANQFVTEFLDLPATATAGIPV
ncbi:MAG TPA: sulfate ABC transporter ATP-binding protein [Chthoniobacterales bacterium]|nr:sulfate ABC transporter ATP-binding protein [Chthoniobacterales bacterium]